MKRDRFATNDELKASLKSDLLDRNTYLTNLMQMLTTISKYTVMALDGDSFTMFLHARYEINAARTTIMTVTITKLILNPVSQYGIEYKSAISSNIIGGNVKGPKISPKMLPARTIQNP